MPDLPQQPEVGEAPRSSNDVVPWAGGFIRGFTRLWTSLVFVVNALCKADTLANKTSVPDLDETFYYETNSKALNVASGGAWEQVGPRRGAATITAGNTSVAVSLSPAEASASYRLSLSTNYDHGGVWWTAKATGGFTANVKNVAPVGGATIDYLILRD